MNTLKLIGKRFVNNIKNKTIIIGIVFLISIFLINDLRYSYFATEKANGGNTDVVYLFIDIATTFLLLFMTLLFKGGAASKVVLVYLILTRIFLAIISAIYIDGSYVIQKTGIKLIYESTVKALNHDPKLLSSFFYNLLLVSSLGIILANLTINVLILFTFIIRKIMEHIYKARPDLLEAVLWKKITITIVVLSIIFVAVRYVNMGAGLLLSSVGDANNSPFDTDDSQKILPIILEIIRPVIFTVWITVASVLDRHKKAFLFSGVHNYISLSLKANLVINISSLLIRYFSSEHEFFINTMIVILSIYSGLFLLQVKRVFITNEMPFNPSIQLKRNKNIQIKTS